MFTYLNRGVLLTGVMSPPVIVNGSNPIRTSSYSVGMKMNINMTEGYIQGGPVINISDFNHKVIEGSINFPLRVDGNGQTELGIDQLINNATTVNDSITLQTLLLPYQSEITGESNPYKASNNSLVFDTCVVSDITFEAENSKDNFVQISANIMGQNDTDNIVATVPNFEESELYRKISWNDCLFYRNNSQLTSLKKIKLNIKKKIGQEFFLMTYNEDERYDSPYSTGTKLITVSFELEEQVYSVFDNFNFSLGGYDNNYNLVMKFGPYQATINGAFLDISTSNLSSKEIIRTTKGFLNIRTDAVLDSPFVLQKV